ncbi:MAG: TetR/AcrR family transcriptional regulator [Candidatus Izemoplasmatales bacterium]
MPSNTFFNLPATKQEIIIFSALKEFSKNAFSEVSINQIVKNAKISRGSFYTYFADKYDLLVYILNLFKSKLQNKIIEISKVVKGDLKLLVIETHQYIYDIYKDEQNKNFLFNIINYFHSHSDEELEESREQLPLLGDCDMIFGVINHNQFKFPKNVNKIKQTINISFILLKNILVISASKNLNYEKSKTLLVEYLDILEHGYKEEQNA